MNRTSKGDGISSELFQILKDDAVKVLHSICQQNSAVATGLEKVSFHSNPKERQHQRMFKLPYNCAHSTCQKVMLKILQARLQQYMNQELPDVRAGFRKGRVSRSNSQYPVDVFQEFSYFLYDPTDVGNLISGSSAFSKSSLNIWKFLVHVMLKSKG